MLASRRKSFECYLRTICYSAKQRRRYIFLKRYFTHGIRFTAKVVPTRWRRWLQFCGSENNRLLDPIFFLDQWFFPAKQYTHALRSHFGHRPLLVLFPANGMKKIINHKECVFLALCKGDCHSQYKQPKHDLSFSGTLVILTIVYTFQRNNFWSPQRYKRNVDRGSTYRSTRCSSFPRSASISSCSL